MPNFSRCTLLLALIALGPCGCSVGLSSTPQASEGVRPSVQLLPSAHGDADEIGSFGAESAAAPAGLRAYRRPFGPARTRQVQVGRHPFR